MDAEETEELLSARAAARLLRATQGISERHARVVLSAGLAGPPLRTEVALLYRSEAVHALAGRPVLEAEELASWGLPALIVLRRAVDVLQPRAVQLDQALGGWELNLWHALGMLFRIRDDGPIPLVVTVCGFVVLGAELTGFDSAGLRVQDPGDWFGALSDCRLRTGPGRAFWMRTWRPLERRTTRG